MSLAGVTSETLRHYDRVGLVRPSRRDEWTGYRYYTERDVVRLKTVRALQQMDLPLREIRRVLAYESLEQIISLSGGGGEAGG
ncbi:MAG: MerR family transcriptional regulator [Oscillospiraceae bacterium]|nr:MerR family transcriptional regulator [Oscillospiraceae bacterium]